MGYIDYCSLCKYSYTSACKYGSKECNQERAKIQLDIHNQIIEHEMSKEAKNGNL